MSPMAHRVTSHMSAFGADRANVNAQALHPITAFIGTNLKTMMIETVRPMTLGNMRANGVQTLAVYCSGRAAIMKQS